MQRPWVGGSLLSVQAGAEPSGTWGGGGGAEWWEKGWGGGRAGAILQGLLSGGEEVSDLLDA